MSTGYALIEEYIGVGKANAVPRKTLCEMTNMNDREMREAIEAAKHAGIPICSDSAGKGYYIVETVEEAKEYLRREEGRAKAIFHGCQPVREFLKSQEAL